MRRLGFLLSIVTLILFGLFSFHTSSDTLYSKPAQDQTITWMTFEEAMAAVKLEKRKVLISVHTEWCSWCKHMDKTTFQDPNIIKFINEKFYAVKLDAEQKEDITTPEKVYKFEKGEGKERGFHQLAIALTMGRLTLPSTVFLDENFRILQPIPSYKDPKTFEMIMTYYGDDHFKNTPWTVYQKTYIPLKKPEPVLIIDDD